MKAGDAPWFGVLPVPGDVSLALNPELDLDALRAPELPESKVD